MLKLKRVAVMAVSMSALLSHGDIRTVTPTAAGKGDPNCSRARRHFPKPAVYDVREFGARGDGVAKDTAAIQAAVDAASAAGGGEVLLPTGTYLSGSVWIKDNVDFHLAPGAVLKGSPDPADYCASNCCPQNCASGLNGDNMSGGHLILAVGAKNFTLRGPGKVDGNSPAFLFDLNGKHHKSKTDLPWRPGQMIWLVDSQDIRITDLELADSPYWSCFILNCDRVSIRGCYVHTCRNPVHTYNGDGIDIDRCRHVTVSDCIINTADDCITLRASGAKRLADPHDCAYVTVANCDLASDCNAIRLGVGEGRIHDAVFTNLTIHDTQNAFNFVAAYSPKSRGTDIADIRIANVQLDAMRFLYLYPGHSTEAEFRDIVFSGVSGKVEKPSHIRSVPGKPMKNLVLHDFRLPRDFDTDGTEIRFE